MSIQKAVILSLFIHAAVFGLSKHRFSLNNSTTGKEGFITLSLSNTRAETTLTSESAASAEKQSHSAEHTDTLEPSTVNFSESSAGKPVETYFAAVRAKIINSLGYPRASRINKEEGTVQLYFSIDNKGTLVNLEVLENCRFENLNKSAVLAVTKASPFEPFPSNINEPALAFKLPLKYELR